MLGWPIAGWSPAGARLALVAAGLRRVRSSGAGARPTATDAIASSRRRRRRAWRRAPQRALVCRQPDARSVGRRSTSDARRSALDASAWAILYPPVRATRAWAITARAGWRIAAIVDRAAAGASRRRRAARRPRPSTTADLPLDAMLPPELRAQLEELLAQIEDGKMTRGRSEAPTLEDLKKLLAKIDPASSRSSPSCSSAPRTRRRPTSQGATKRSLDGSREGGGGQRGHARGRARALEDLAAKLANSDAGKRQGKRRTRPPRRTPAETGKASAQARRRATRAWRRPSLQLVARGRERPGAAR